MGFSYGTSGSARSLMKIFLHYPEIQYPTIINLTYGAVNGTIELSLIKDPQYHIKSKFLLTLVTGKKTCFPHFAPVDNLFCLHEPL